jgi:hypothetical protein
MTGPNLGDLLAEVRATPGLWAKEAYAARTQALERLELAALARDGHFGGAWATGRPSASAALSPAQASALLDEADALTRRLMEANRRLCAELRGAIRSGTCRGSQGRRTLAQVVPPRWAAPEDAEEEYDLADSLVSELLLQAEAPEPTLRRVPDAIAYQPTPARVSLELIERLSLGPDDLFYDLGSGLGQVCLLVNWLSGARARGIEVEPAYCRYATRQARALGLDGVEFVEGNALSASLAGGTCYYLYTPFGGRTLARTLERLAREARTRPLTVAAYGPCVPTVARQQWLAPLDGNEGSGLAVFRAAKVRLLRARCCVDRGRSPAPRNG